MPAAKAPYGAAPLSAWPPPATSRQPPAPSFRPESRLIERVHWFLHVPDFIQEVRVQNHLHDLTGDRPASWYFASLPPDRLNAYARDLDSMVAAIRAAGAEPVVGVYPMRFGRHLTVDDSAMMAAWRQYAARARPQALLDFMWAVRDTMLDMGRREKFAVVDLPAALNGHTENFDDAVHYTALGAQRVAGLVARTVLDVRPPHVPAERR